MKDKKIRRLLLDLGIYSNIQGYHYIIEAYNIISTNKIHTSMTTIYNTISKKVGKNPSAIERGIRFSIQRCWKKGFLNKIYKEIPDNSVFLYDIYFNYDIIENKLKTKE